MARADDPAFGQGPRSVRAQDEYDRRTNAPLPGGDPRRRPPPPEPQTYRADPRRAPQQPDPRAAVPPTRARAPITAASEQSYIPQFDRYEPQRTGNTQRQAPLPQTARPAPERLDPSQFGGQPAPAPQQHRQPMEPRIPALDPRYAAPTQPMGRSGTPRYEPQFEDEEPHYEGGGHYEQPATNGYARPAAPPRQAMAQPPVMQPPPAPMRQQPQQWQQADDQDHDDILEEGDAAFDDQEVDFDLDDEDETPPRRRRMLMAAGAIGIAVLLGAGIGLGYKVFNGDGESGAELPIAQADIAPAKKKAEDQAAAGNTKSVYRIGDESTDPSTIVSRQESPVTQTVAEGDPALAVTPAVDSDVSQGPRKVQTITIKPGDTIAQQGELDVPGISLAPVGDEPPLAAPVPPKAVKPKQLAAAVNPPAVEEQLAVQEPVTEPVEPPPVTKPVKKVKTAAVKAPAVEQDAESLTGPALDGTQAQEQPAVAAKPQAPKATTVATTASGGKGFVAQIKASKSRVDALGSFADVQQRFAEVLSNAQPDIQEADLGDKGVWYRLRIGPPGSRKSAGDLCTQLKARGMKECIVVAY